MAAGKNVKTSHEESQELYFEIKKYPWIYPAVMVILSLIDLSLLVFYYKIQYLQGRNILVQLLALHVVMFFIIVIFRRTSAPQTKEISPLIMLILPGFGSLLFSVTYLALFLVGAKFKKDAFHHDLKDSDIEYKEAVTVDMKQVNRLMDLAGVFHYSDSASKKETIVDLLSGDISANAKQLKSGLSDKDPEVVHYTASTLNYLEEKFEKAIQKARQRCVKNLTREGLLEVGSLYRNYIKSGLMEEDILPIYYGSYIQVLELILEEYGEKEDVFILLIQAFLDSKQLDKADRYMTEAVDLYPENIQIRLMEMKYQYARNRLKEVGKIAQLIRDLDEEMTEEERNLVDFWITEGVKS